MITLYGFGPRFGLPEASPYVTKAEVQLKMAGLPYVKQVTTPDTSPKGQLPYIDDGDARVADSTFIRIHLEESYGIDLDAGLDDRQRAEAWAIERMTENHFTWSMTYARWMLPENFAKGPAHFFDGAPGRRVHHLLDPLHDHGRVLRDLARHRPRGVEQRRLALVHVIDEADAQRPRGVDVLAGEGELARVPLAKDARQALQAAQVGHHRHLDFADAEARVGGGDADVAGGDEVDAAADAPAADRRDHRLATGGDRFERALQLLDERQQLDALAGELRTHQVRPDGGTHRREVEPVAEMAALAAHDDGAHRRIGIERVEDARHLLPEIGPHRVAFAGADENYLGDVLVPLDAQCT